MTEKILRDGVDVAGCCLYCGGNCMQRMVDKNSIDNDVTCNGICDYGALYRKEQLTKLKQELTKLKQEHEELKEQCAKYAQINEQDTKDYAELKFRLQIMEEKVEALKYENSRLKDNKIKELGRALEAEDKYKSALEEIKRVINLAHRTEDYLLGQDYTDLVDRIQKELNEVLNEGK